jgi:hypothetical protein
MNVQQVVNLLKIANTDLPDIQCRYERLKREVCTLEFNKQQSHKAMAYFNNQIEMKSKALTSYRLSCIRERREIENLYNEKTRLEAIVSQFKSNNEEYLKIKQTVEEEVISVPTNGKVLMQFALASVIEAIRRNVDKYNNILAHNMQSSSSTTTMPTQQSSPFHIDDFKDIILDEANRLYDRLLNHFTNSIMDNAANAYSSDPTLLLTQSSSKYSSPFNQSVAPYLINIKKLPYTNAFDIRKDWLSRCSSIQRLDFNSNYHTKYAIDTAVKSRIFHMRLDTLKEKNKILYDLLRNSQLPMNKQ